jgi:hypothetical protein
MPGRSRRPPFNACLNHGDRPRINAHKVYGYEPSMSNAATMALNGMVHQWDGDADNGDADTVAKFLKCPAINFQQIDQTRAVDLTFAAPGRPPCSERGAGMMRSAVSAAQITTAR